MQDKLSKSSTTSNRIPGLLVWYGTGTGKTITASIVAKIVGFCNIPRNIAYSLDISVVQNIIITSPKSAFNNFKKELESIMQIYLNKLQTKESSDIDNFYFNGKNTNIYIFSHPKFNDIFGNSLNDPSSFFNETFLSNSLLIVDEIHNYSNTEGIENTTATNFMLKCCNIAKQVLLLTATPMRNSPKDMEIILAFLDGRKKLNKNFEPEYIGKYEDPFIEGTKPKQVLSSNNVSENPTFYDNVEFGDTKIQPVSKILKNKDDIRDGKINTQLVNPPSKKPKEIREYFKERIIYYMPEEQAINPLPPYVEKIYFAFPLNDIDRNDYIQKFLNIEKLKCKNDTIDCTNPFYSKENEYIWKNTTIKTDSILNIIAIRELTPENKEISYIKNPVYNFENFGVKNNSTFKYIIYCNYEINIKKIKEALINIGVKETYIGIIKGSTTGSDRKLIASNYDLGKIKIVILSKAGEEGVDFKRTGVIILADGVWTSSEYEQILGRAVRKNSNNPSTDDPYTKIPSLIECISLVFSCRFNKGFLIGIGDIKYSGDLSQFKIILKKKAIINKFKESIEPYFYNINNIVSGTGEWKKFQTNDVTENSLQTIKYDGGVRRKSIKKKSIRRKSLKKKSPRRKSIKKKSPRRKSIRKKSPRRKSIRKKSPRRKSIRKKSTRRLATVNYLKDNCINIIQL